MKYYCHHWIWKNVEITQAWNRELTEEENNQLLDFVKSNLEEYQQQLKFNSFVTNPKDFYIYKQRVRFILHWIDRDLGYRDCDEISCNEEDDKEIREKFKQDLIENKGVKFIKGGKFF